MTSTPRLTPRPRIRAVALVATVLLALAALPASAATSSFQLSGDQEAPPIATDAVGNCVASLTADRTQFDLTCTHDAEDPIMWHIHRGRTGVSGPILVDPGEDGSSPIELSMAVDEDFVSLLLTGELYVNVHTVTNPGGEIRGQILMLPAPNVTSTLFPLTGEQETPPVETEDSGWCRADVTLQDTPPGLFLVCQHSIEEPTLAHIHVGDRGVPGPVEIDLGDPASPIFHEAELTAEQVTQFLAGDWYVNVHTEANPDGEIRGQMDGCFADANTLCLQGGRFGVEVTFTDSEDNSFNGRAVAEAGNTGMFWFLDPGNLEMLIKVLNGCDINERFWVFFAATTDVAFELTVTDHATGEVEVYENPLGQAADAVTDTDAFATCP